ncbi:hypothetical protein [Halpernia sp.]|uniref:hypothetical protein n=1 Tax=Halpernia sp. TaxID=2782209 RepID=UPI003A8F61B5
MKTKIFTLILIGFITSFISAQTLVKPADFNMKDIASYLKTQNFVINTQTNDYLKITDDQNSSIFIDLAKDKKFLLFNVKILLKKDAKISQIESLLTKINDLDMIKAKYLPADNTVFFKYYFWIDGGFTKETLKDALVEFGLYQGDSYGLDKDKIFEYE